MPIADGEPADDGDIWFRVLTEESYIRKGKIHPQAFKGSKTIAAPDPAKQRQWSHELSGRLRSLVSDVVDEANAYCEEITRTTKQTKTFNGVMYCSIPEATKEFEKTITTQVCYTPRQRDKAHADFTFTGSADATEDVFDRVRLWLCDVVNGLHPAQIKLLPRATTTPTGYSVPE
jgi:hypothetical protein